MESSFWFPFIQVTGGSTATGGTGKAFDKASGTGKGAPLDKASGTGTGAPLDKASGTTAEALDKACQQTGHHQPVGAQSGVSNHLTDFCVRKKNEV